MNKSRQEIKAELKDRTEELQKKVIDVFGDYSRDIDFSSLNLFATLLYQVMNADSQNPGKAGRDKLVISDFRVMPSLLAVLADVGFINWKECRDMILQLPKLFSSPNIALANYPGLDLASHNPYLGMTTSLGEALVGKRARCNYRVYHILGEKRSTRIQNMLMTASSSHLNNITAVIPNLEIQKRPSVIHFWFSMGWQLEEVRFEETSSIFEGFLRAARGKEKPQVLL